MYERFDNDDDLSVYLCVYVCMCVCVYHQSVCVFVCMYVPLWDACVFADCIPAGTKIDIMYSQLDEDSSGGLNFTEFQSGVKDLSKQIHVTRDDFDIITENVISFMYTYIHICICIHTYKHAY